MKYATAGELMKAVRALDVEERVAVLDAFVDFYSEVPTCSSVDLCERFEDDYGTYREFKDGDHAMMYLKRSVCSMEILVDEMDSLDPMNFYTLAEKLDEAIKKQKLTYE